MVSLRVLAGREADCGDGRMPSQLRRDATLDDRAHQSESDSDDRKSSQSSQGKPPACVERTRRGTAARMAAAHD